MRRSRATSKPAGSPTEGRAARRTLGNRLQKVTALEELPDLSGQIVVVTRGTDGVGRAVVDQLADVGATVVRPGSGAEPAAFSLGHPIPPSHVSHRGRNFRLMKGSGRQRQRDVWEVRVYLGHDPDIATSRQ